MLQISFKMMLQISLEMMLQISLKMMLQISLKMMLQISLKMMLQISLKMMLQISLKMMLQISLKMMSQVLLEDHSHAHPIFSFIFDGNICVYFTISYVFTCWREIGVVGERLLVQMYRCNSKGARSSV